MILRNYDLNKLDISKNNIILFYGQNPQLVISNKIKKESIFVFI